MESPRTTPIPEDQVASDIWLWIADNAYAWIEREHGQAKPAYLEGSIGYCRQLADHLRRRGHIKDFR
jgi:hypothetical protein